MITIDHLGLRDFRSYEHLEVRFSPGLTAIIGDNGNGKTNLIESIGFLARMDSFRGAPLDALVRSAADRAVIRADLTCGDRDVLIEAELPRQGRVRVQVNKNRWLRRADRAEVMTTTVFSPDDLEVIKGGPGVRRRYLDDLLADLHAKNEAAFQDFAKVLKQRNALLKQMSSRPNADDELTLDVWDQRFVEHGERLAHLRTRLIERLTPSVQDSYALLSESDAMVVLRYQSEWAEVGLAAALSAARPGDIRRGLSTVGPHRDDLAVSIASMNARTHSSQGEQRCLVLALRLAGHDLVTEARGQAPILLLDDVFSELDQRRSTALISCLGDGQRILTTATDLPPEIRPDSLLRIEKSTATFVV